MEQNCPNCDQIISGNYCSNCGQKKYSRIDRKYILDELTNTFLQSNKGFLYTVKNIIKNPGKTAREFIEGNRINHYKPTISLVLVFCAIDVFISFKIIDINNIIRAFPGLDTNTAFANDLLTLISSYLSIIMLLSIPFFAFFTKLSFRKCGHNYYEHIVMNSYIISLFYIIEIIFIYPIFYIVRNNADLFIRILNLPIFISPFILIWFFKGFYTQKTLKSIIGRVLIATGLIILGFIILYVIIIVILIKIKGLEYIQPQ